MDSDCDMSFTYHFWKELLKPKEKQEEIGQVEILANFFRYGVIRWHIVEIAMVLAMD